jgi:hypothetical protein
MSFNMKTFMAGVNHVNNISNLPPTHTMLPNGMPQFVPDPIRKVTIEQRMKDVDKSEKALEEALKQSKKK